MTITYDVVLEVTSQNYPHIVNLKQGATRTTVILHLTNQNESIDLSNCAFGFTAWKDGTQLSHNYGWYRDGVCWIVPPEVTNDTGTVKCQLTVTDATGTVIYTPVFQAVVGSSLEAQPSATVGIVTFDGLKEQVVLATQALNQAYTLQGQAIEAANAAEKAKIDAETARDDIKELLVYPAYAHNAIYRGKNLTNIYTIDEICTMISAGTFDDLFIGDYFDITISSEYTASETVRCVLAGFDIYYGRNVLFENKHHAVIIPNDCFKSLAAMNSTATTSGAFRGTDMMQTILPVYESALKNVLGDHMIKFETVITSAISTDGASNAGAGFTGCSSQTTGWVLAINLLSEIQVYGSSIFSSSCYEYQRSGDVRFPIFALHPQFVIPNLSVTDKGVSTYRMNSYWLRNVVSSTQFALVNYLGYFGADCAAANLKHGVRPYFLIG